jgi:hypothetical protein
MTERSIVLIAAAALPALVVFAVNTQAALTLMVNAKLFLEVVLKLLNEGNRDRALKLSGTLDAPVVKLARFALELRLPLFQGERVVGDYRDAAPSDLAARAQVALEAHARVQLRRFLPSVLVAPLALLSPLVLLDVPDEHLKWVVVACAVGFLSGAASVARYVRVKGQLADVAQRLAPWVLPE